MIDSQYYFVSPAENHLIAVTYFVSIFVSILLLQTNQSPSDQNQTIDLLGSFGEFAITPASQPQTLVAQATPGQDVTFDLFAGVTAEPPAATRKQSEEGPPNSPDFNEFLPLQMEEPMPKPRPKGVIPQALPPPPSKKSVKAANQLKGLGILPLVTSPTSPSFPTSPLSPSNGNFNEVKQCFGPQGLVQKTLFTNVVYRIYFNFVSLSMHGCEIVHENLDVS